MFVASGEVYAGIIADEENVWVCDAGADYSKLGTCFVFCQDLGEAKIYREHLISILSLFRSSEHVQRSLMAGGRQCLW